MNLPGVQETIALLIVLAAAVWLAMRWWRRRGKSSGCEHCPAAAAGNPPCQAPPQDTLITIGPAQPPASGARPQPIRR
ncbi:MAG: hypothetical protein K8R56_03935 [Candidatus Eisenbacteria bacterium]|nr:hypothetical protein [Candidatus Eisenbacteria bacterium]